MRACYERGHFNRILSKTPHDARFGHGPHNATDAAKCRSTQNVCRSRFPGISCTHKPPSIIHRSRVVIQSPVARKPTGSDVRARRRQSYTPCTDCRVKALSIACEPESVRKSRYKQVTIARICSGLVPQSQAITATSKSLETHLIRIKPNAMHCHTHATGTPWPLLHACVPWCMVTTILYRTHKALVALLLPRNPHGTRA